MKNNNIFDINKKEENIVINIPEIESKLKELINLDKDIEEKQEKRSKLDLEIKEIVKNQMTNIYNSTKKFPGTLKIFSGNINFQFVTYDRYKNIDKEQYDLLQKTYGKVLVEENKIFSFNNSILLKHKNHISKLLMSSKKLTKEEKQNLLINDISYVIKRGVIKNLFSIVKNNINNIIKDIEPVFQIKSIKESNIE